MTTAVAAIAPLSVLGVALTSTSWWEGVTAAVGYLLTFGVLREWSLDGYPRRAVLALMFTAAAWFIGALTASSPISFVPLSLVGALLVARTRRRTLWILGLASGVGAIGAMSFLSHPVTWELTATYLATPAVGTLFVAGVILLSEQTWQVVRTLERARETEAELAVAHERMRIADDLHDIQGHSLHVIKLKAALARRMVRIDPERSEAELDEIRQLAEKAIAETRTLASAHHELNLVAELENAKRLCEATGIAVELRFVEGTGASAHPLLAQVLREATTNLLRHAHPTVVTITASAVEVEVANDGVIDDAASPLRGLARLSERVERAGGELRVERSPERFVVAARLNPEPAARVEGEPR
ncbi:sensor histidine kinase [Dietzia sp. PP-33]|uniref:sensor histidine kinase n=1 Tax=Dietzia sp. PP-33 TaxID=2957500 RepID=UPI0029B11587|nr:histidine kinase [Dietzia sp. PP-33]MDX2358916.1 histidine kinase [Dietzia sp. PP-33]